MNITQNLTLDLGKKGEIQYVFAKQGDNSRYLKILLTNEGAPVSMQTGAKAYFRAQKPDGTMTLIPAALNEDGTITVELTQQTMAVCGEVYADVYLTDQNQMLISSASFVLCVESAPMGKVISSSNEVTVFQNMVTQAELAAAKAQQAANAAANKLPLAGGKMGGNIDMGGHGIFNVKAPTAAGDVVTKGSLLDLVYPVGSIYMSVEDTSPAARWGGTWEKIEGRVLAGAGSPQPNTSNTFGALSGQSWRIAAKEKGGQDYHTLTKEEMPAHSHDIVITGSGETSSVLNWQYTTSRIYQGGDMVKSTGGGKPHNNMMPYYGVHIWKRVA